MLVLCSDGPSAAINQPMSRVRPRCCPEMELPQHIKAWRSLHFSPRPAVNSRHLLTSPDHMPTRVRFSVLKAGRPIWTPFQDVTEMGRNKQLGN